MISVMNCQADQLVLHPHQTNFLPGAGGAADHVRQAWAIFGDEGGFLRSIEEAPAELLPGLYRRLRLGRERVGDFRRVRSLDAGNPVERNLLPEGQVPQLLVDRMRHVLDREVNQIMAERLQDMSGSRE